MKTKKINDSYSLVEENEVDKFEFRLSDPNVNELCIKIGFTYRHLIISLHDTYLFENPIQKLDKSPFIPIEDVLKTDANWREAEKKTFYNPVIVKI